MIDLLLVRKAVAAVLPGLMLGVAIFLCSGERFSWRKLGMSCGLMMAEALLFILIFEQDSPVKLGLMVISLILVNWWVMGFRGRRLLLYSFVSIMITFCGDIMGGLMCMSLFDAEMIAAMRYMTTPWTYVLQFSTGGSMILLALMWRGGVVLLRKRRTRLQVGYLLRPAFLMVVISLLFFRALNDLTLVDQVARVRTLLPDFLIIALLLITGVTYIAQDIQHFQQMQQNRELLHRQSLQELLLQDTRVFRHNISNMLYGLQGMLLSGDIDALNAYYKRMVEACQLINNENVVALKRIPSVAVSSLLLNKIQQAHTGGIPFFCTVEESIHWHGMRDDEMTQVLGVLIDNAMEAAAASRAPYVSFEAGNVGEALAITIRNTFPDGEPPVFTSDMASTKEGHEGIGLRSVRRITGRSRSVLFNIYAHGRYVEASLTCY